MACGILVPLQGLEPVPPAVDVKCLNHWTAREFPQNVNDCNYLRTSQIVHLFLLSRKKSLILSVTPMPRWLSF